MKIRLFVAVLAAVCAFGASAEGDWKTTLGKVADLSGDTGLAGFAKREAPAYITGNWDEAERPHKPSAGATAANDHGYYGKDGAWHGGCFDDTGVFDEGQFDHTPVRIIVLTVAPKNYNAPYLQLMASLSRILHASSAYRRLLMCTSAESMKDFFSSKQKEKTT